MTHVDDIELGSPYDAASKAWSVFVAWTVRFVFAAIFCFPVVSGWAAEPLVVFAASSLTDAFRDAGELFVSQPGGCKVTLAFGASNELRMQLEHGATADLFASASTREMDRAVAAGLVEESSVFARNKLVVVMPALNPGKVGKLQDLAQPGLKLVLAHPNVPAGSYTSSALDRLGAGKGYGRDFKRRVLANVVSLETNVRQVLAKVRMGEADAGVVYFSDVTPKLAGELKVLSIPDEFNAVAAYPIAIVKGTQRTAFARRFLEFVLSREAQAIFLKYKFEVPAR